MHNFQFGNKNLLNFSGRIAQAPTHQIAQRDFDLAEIPGCSGDVFLDNERYKNVKFDIPVYFMPFLSKSTAKQLAYAVIDWLATCVGYQEYRDTYNPGYYTKAVLTNLDEIKYELPTLLSAKLSFSRLPHWYSLEGKKAVEIPIDQTPVKLYNKEPFASEPIIIYRNEIVSLTKAVVTINGNETSLTALDSYIERRLDGPAKQYVGFKADGTRAYLGTQLPPNLHPGQNEIIGKSQSGSLKIIPNWRRL